MGRTRAGFVAVGRCVRQVDHPIRGRPQLDPPRRGRHRDPGSGAQLVEHSAGRGPRPARPPFAQRGAQHPQTVRDGVEVAVAVYRRSLKNPKLAANLWTYLARDTVMGNVEELMDVATRDLPARAAQSRARSKAAAEKALADHRRQQAAV